MNPFRRLREERRDLDLEYKRSSHASTDTLPLRASMANPDPGNRALISPLQQKVQEAEKKTKQCETGRNNRIKVLWDEVRTLKSKVKALEDHQHTSRRPKTASNKKQPDRLTQRAVNALRNLVTDGHKPRGERPGGSLLAQTGRNFERRSRDSTAAERAQWDEHVKLQKEKTERCDALVQQMRPSILPANKTKSPVATPEDQFKDRKSSSRNLQPDVSSPYRSPTGKFTHCAPATGSPSLRCQKTTRAETVYRSPIDQETARTDSPRRMSRAPRTSPARLNSARLVHMRASTVF